MAGYRRAAATGAALGALALVVAVVAVVLTGGDLGGVYTPTKPTRALIILEGAGEQGVRVAQSVIDVDWSARPAKVVIVDPMTDVLVPGTSYRTMRDAFAFGGGPAVADAYSRLATGGIVPSVVLDSPAWGNLVDQGGGLPVSLDSTVQVFTGERLYVFDATEETVRGAEVSPLLTGLDYRESTEEALEVRSDLADLVLRQLARTDWDSSPLQSAHRATGLAGPVGDAALQSMAAALDGVRVIRPKP